MQMADKYQNMVECYSLQMTTNIKPTCLQVTKLCKSAEESDQF